MPHLDVAGASLYYETDGHVSKPAILLIHAGIATLRMWDPIVPALARDHFVVRYDTRGFGATTTDDVEFSDRDDARAILDHLGIDHATVIGCSRGGGIAIDLAVETPERVRALVTIGSGASGFPDIELTAAEEAIIDRMDAAFEAADWPLLNELEVRLWSIGPMREPGALDPAFADLAFALNRENLPHVSENPRPIPLDPPAYYRLVDIRIPTLVTVGDHDLSETLAAFEYLLTNIPTADGVRFRESAHLPSVEQADEFTRELTDWLSAHDL